MKFSFANSPLFAIVIAVMLSAITPVSNSSTAIAQEVDAAPKSTTDGSSKKTTEQKSDSAQSETDIKKLHEMFSKQMKGCKMIGLFTMDGEAEGKRRPEEYHILSANKLDKGDQWSIVTRFKYGGKDFMTWPITVEVKFAGDTPMIIVDNMTVPNQGTFSARVLFTKDQYAGTWSNGSVGGHMFGKLGRLSPDEMKQRRRKKSDSAKSDK